MQQMSAGHQGGRVGRRSRPVTRVFLASSAIVGMALIAAACGGSSTSPAGSAGGTGAGTTTLTLYSAQHEETTTALIAAFTKQTGIKVKVDNDDEDVLTAQIEQEGSRSPADVFYTENSNWLEQLGERGMLAGVAPATLANVPKADSATSGDWVGVSARIAVLVYNKTKLTPAQLPTTVLAMADPQYKGKLEIAPSETDFWPVIDSVDKTYGSAATLAWLKGLKTNAGANDNVPDNETITSDVSKGTVAMGLVNHYYFYRYQAEVGSGTANAAIAYFAPHDAGYVEGISGAAVLKSSKHQAAAQEFLAFLTSQAGQNVLAHSEIFEYPIRPGVAGNSELTPLAQLQPSSFSPADLGTGLEAKTLLQQAGLL